MVRRLMAFDPSAETRMDIKESLAHPYMKQFVTGDEQTCPAILTVPIDDDIKHRLGLPRQALLGGGRQQEGQRQPPQVLLQRKGPLVEGAGPRRREFESKSLPCNTRKMRAAREGRTRAAGERGERERDARFVHKRQRRSAAGAPRA